MLIHNVLHGVKVESMYYVSGNLNCRCNLKMH